MAGWSAAFDNTFTQVVAPVFAQREPRLRARSYLLGLASGVERKNGWTLAELAGEGIKAWQAHRELRWPAYPAVSGSPARSSCCSRCSRTEVKIASAFAALR